MGKWFRIKNLHCLGDAQEFMVPETASLSDIRKEALVIILRHLDYSFVEISSATGREIAEEQK